MPGSKKKKRFIDKKNAVTFRLVHRSQRDPLTADERAPKHVLLEQANKQHVAKSNGHSSSQLDVSTESVEKRKEEQQKYGILFDDDYNYLQHLKDLGEVTFEAVAPFDGVNANRNEDSEKLVAKMTLPSSVFASNVEEEIGLLNRAAPVRGPQPDLDPDIMAALDSDCEMSDSDDELDDDFVIKANEKRESTDSDDECDSEKDADSGSNCSEETSSFEGNFINEETKSRFTEYSMSSSVLRRNEGLTLLDDRFEKIFEEYDEDQIGALDGEEVEGYLQPGNVLLESVIENFKKDQMDSELTDLRRELATLNEDIEETIIETSSEEDDDEIVKMVLDEPAEKWDCESILSTYSNLYNHPKLIKEPPKVKPIIVSSKTGVPVGVFVNSGLTAAALKNLDVQSAIPTEISSVNKSTPKRDKDETTEEKRNRKQAIKEQRRERRVEKKANSLAFKEEKKKQAKAMVNIQQNIKGIKLS